MALDIESLVHGFVRDAHGFVIREVVLQPVGNLFGRPTIDPFTVTAMRFVSPFERRLRSRTLHILAAENIIAREYGSRVSSNQVKQLSAEGVDDMPLTDDVKYALKANVAVVKTLSEQIAVIEKRIQERVISRAEYRLLHSVPGTGKALAPVILLETGSIERFKEVGNFVPYARCVDSEHASNA